MNDKDVSRRKIVIMAAIGMGMLLFGIGVVMVESYSPTVFGATIIGSGITTDGVLKVTSNGATDHYVLTSDSDGNASWMSLQTELDPGHANVTTNDLTEGGTNLYFSNARVDSRIAQQTDSLFSVSDAIDPSRSVGFDVSGASSTRLTLETSQSSNKTLTFPDFNGTLIAADRSTGIVFINQPGSLHGSNSGIQYSSLIANRGQIRMNQYGNNAGVPGISSFKSRGVTIGSLAPVQPGDVIFRDTAVGVTDNLSIPLSGLISIVVPPNGVPLGQGWIATDYQLQLTPLNGPANGRKEAFRVTSEGILHIKEQANAMAGVVTLGTSGEMTVPNTQITATSRVSLTIQDGGVVPTGFAYLASRTIGTDFIIKSSAGAADNGVRVYYQIWEPTTS